MAQESVLRRDKQGLFGYMSRTQAVCTAYEKTPGSGRGEVRELKGPCMRKRQAG